MSRRTREFNPTFRRRAFLGGIGAAAIAAPIVPMFDAGAADNGYPKRLLLVHTPDGAVIDNWRPSGGEYDFTLSQILAPLEEFRDKLVVLDNLRMTAGGAGEQHAYGMAGLWTGAECLQGNLFDGGNNKMTGWGSGRSIDQYVADLFEEETPYRSLEFGVQCGDPNIVSRMIYAGPEAPIHPESNPYSMFDKLFAAADLSEAELNRLRARRQSVLDRVQAELLPLQSKIAAHDRAKLEAHLEAVRAIEKRLDQTLGACNVIDVGGQIDVNANDNFQAIGDLQMRLAASAFACDLTRVASIQWSRGFSGIRHHWLGYDEHHHGYSHMSDRDLSHAASTAIDTWYAERFRDLLTYLSSYKEGDGTLLDNTIIVWGRELGYPPSHHSHPLPLVVAGSGGGAIRTGRYLDYGDEPHVKLLISICQAMGMSDMQSLGNLQPNTGGLDNLLV